MRLSDIEKYVPKHTSARIQGTAAVFEVSVSALREISDELYHEKKLSLMLITATDERKENGCFKVWYVFGAPEENICIVPYIQIKNTFEFPSLTSSILEARHYERKIQTFFGLTAVGHPDARPIVLHENWPADVFPLRKDFYWTTRPPEAHGVYEFQHVGGEGIYEIPVGPIHAGIIEPGHFRFSVAGEEIILLEPRLGFTHKGSEKLFERLPVDEKVWLSEKISGDSSFSHSLAFCQAAEELAGIVAPRRARYLRVIYAELERVANHLGDIGAIMLDTGFNFGGAHGARLREKSMQIHQRLTASRFLRRVNMIGGVMKDIDGKEKDRLSADLAILLKDFSEVIEIAEDSSSLLNRLKGTGVLSYEIAKDRGVVGVAAKALGIIHDARVEYPYAAYHELAMGEIASHKEGDVYARFRVRVQEVYQSIEIIKKALTQLPDGPLAVHTEGLSFAKNALAISIVEGWRGAIVYFLATDSSGNISRVAPRDPSFINWAVLGSAGFGNVVPDFPLINKSFNLSYSGSDL